MSVEITASIELYEHDRPRLAKVLNALTDRVGKTGPLEDFRQEVLGRFFDAGYVAEVKVWEVYQTDSRDNVLTGPLGDPLVDFYSFAVDIVGRADGTTDFDHEQQRHEVRQAEGLGNPLAVSPGERRTESGIVLPPV